jgi:signal transduction histidine kinase
MPVEHGSDEEAGDAGAFELRRLVHDLLQSVAIVQAVVSMVRHDEQVTDRLREQMSLIERETQTIAAMCQRARNRAAPPVLVDLGDVVGTVVERVRLAYPGDISVEIDDATLLADEIDWARALFNLVENACRAAGPGGKVVVSVQRDADTVRIAVGDSGPGFGKGSAGSASLGLATVSQVVHSHGGHLELRRSPLGGALVTIVVPGASGVVGPARS